MLVSAENGPRPEREVKPAAGPVLQQERRNALVTEPPGHQPALVLPVQPEIAAARADDHGRHVIYIILDIRRQDDIMCMNRRTVPDMDGFLHDDLRVKPGA